MATSKMPVDIVDVPKAILDFAATNSAVHCNLRPDKRPLPEDKRERELLAVRVCLSDSIWVDPIYDFLKGLTQGTRLAIHFQGYGTEVGTAVVELQRVFWTQDGYPRLDFEHPPAMRKIHGCPNFWGAFILAVGKVNDEPPVHAQKDTDGTHFTQLVKRHGLAA